MKDSKFLVEITDTDQLFHNIPLSLNAILEASVKSNWERPSLSDFKGETLSFGEIAVIIEKLHITFDLAGLKPGDKVAICGKNSARWAMAFIACLTAGVVAVPILHEFKPETIHHLINHSGAKILFVDEAIWRHIENMEMPNLECAVYISEKGMPLCKSEAICSARDNIEKYFKDRYPHGFTANDIHWYKDNPDDLALINYTSGSTGMSKGVMLPFRSIWSNIKYCMEHLTFLLPGDGQLNMLPLAHLYGMVIEMLHPFAKGCHCTFLGKTPSPAILLSAFAEVRPKLIITVPLVLEKIVKTKVFPVIEQPKMKFLLRLPIIRTIIMRKIKDQLIKALGGNVLQVIIGGAALNAEVGTFLTKINFPVTVGYGMTECGPLITYERPELQPNGTVGKIVDRMEYKVDSPDPETVPGNLWVKGDNVMTGYYNNPEATREVMKDGWMNTGDMVTVDKEGNIRIMGRSKTMILGPSGQNIYPEEIEQKINNLPYVVESVVIDDNGKLVALIYPDFDLLKKDGKDVDAVMADNLKALNPQLPGYSRISDIRIFDKEFEKTPKRSIKRFLYQP